jgi:hypothetical protein
MCKESQNRIVKDRHDLRSLLYHVYKNGEKDYRGSIINYDEFELYWKCESRGPRPKEKYGHPIRKALDSIFRDNYKSHNLSKSVDKPGNISFAKCKEHKYNDKRRVTTSLGKYLNKQFSLGDKISENIIATFCGRVVNLQTAENDTYKIIRGDELGKAYLNYVGGSSCMTHGDNQDKIQLYVENPERVSMLVYTGTKQNGERYSARTLLWKTDCGNTVVDRIYPNSGPHCDAIRYWASEKGYITRNGDALPCSGERISLSDHREYFVTLDSPKNGRFPYCDTFHYCDSPYRGKITLSNDPIEREGCLASTCGDIDNLESGNPCCNCGSTVENDNEFHSNYDGPYCETCYYELYSSCESCGDTVDNESIIECEGNYVCERCADREYPECDITGERSSELVEMPDGRNVIESEYCDHVTFCEFCDTELMMVDIIPSDIDQQCRCTDCHDDHITEHETQQSENVESGVTL